MNTQQLQSQTIVDMNGRMQAANDGTCHFIGSKSGNIVYPAGSSLFWAGDASAYYNQQTIHNLKTQYNCQIIRAAMSVKPIWGDGYITDPVRFQGYAEAVINAAIAEGIYVIIDFHIEGDCSGYVNQAKTFFAAMAQKYGQYDNVIYELWNEPTTQSWNSTIRPYCVAVTNAIRQYDPDNLILCGTQTWSQLVEDASYNQISDANLGYVFHFYCDIHSPSLYANKANLKVPVFVTEWGSPGSVANTDGFVNWMKTNKIPNCSWAVNNKDEALSYFTIGNSNTTGPWVASDLRAAGTLLTGITLNWPGNLASQTCGSIIIPGKLEAENYCDMSGIQTETCSEGGQNASYIDSNDWMTYNVNVTTAGVYLVSYRVASLSGGGKIQLDKDAGATILGTVDVPSTGGWQTWSTITQLVTLPAGNYNLGINANAGGFNLNWITLIATGSTIIQTEDYCLMSGVLKETCSDTDGGQNVGYIETNDWMKYCSINFPVSGTYTFEYRVASASGGQLSIDLNAGTTQLGSCNVPATGGWQTWSTISQTASVTAGTYDLGVFAKTGGWNINWIKITQGTIKTTEVLFPTEDGITKEFFLYPTIASTVLHLEVNGNVSVEIYDLQGKLILSKNLGLEREINIENLKTGMYIVQTTTEGLIYNTKIIKQ